MKVCQLIASRGNGGLEKHVRELSIALSEQGIDVVVLAHPDFLQTLPDCITKEALPSQLSRHNPFLQWRLLKMIRHHQPDIIHAQANKAVELVSKLKRYLNAPLIGTLHNIKKNTRAFSKMDQVIAVSHQLSNGFTSDQVTVIYNGINVEPPAKLDIHHFFQLPTDKPVLCAIGRLVEAKGFDILLEAIHGLDLSLLIIGDGPEQAALEQLIRQQGLSENVKLLGHRDDVSTIINATDAVVIPSRREGFSYVFSEALLLNKPILACDVPVANELLPDALIVPINNADLLRERLMELMTNPIHWQEMIKKVHQTTAPLLTLEAMSHQTLSVYHKLCPFDA